ncbi:MAG: MMPL family transporter, partial [Myxococcales bacterium]|nr:MMPL family transporter [Myxococcales bacterium]
EVELRADAPWLEPPRLAELAAFEAWARAQPEVRAVLGPAMVHALVPPFGATPPEVTDLRRRVLDEAGTRARVSLGVPDVGGQAFVALAERVRERAATLPGQVTVTGTPLLAYRGVNRIADELRTSLLGVVAVVTLAIAVLLRSARLSLAALVPNVLPLAVAYAGLGGLGIELDPLAAVILCVALSIAVDDSLHLLARAREGRARGEPASDALEQAVARSGHAALVTSVALTGGLAVNLWSSFPPLRLLGALGASTIALAWVLDVLMLPGLLRAAGFERSGAAVPSSEQPRRPT